VQKRIAVSY